MDLPVFIGEARDSSVEALDLFVYLVSTLLVLYIGSAAKALRKSLSRLRENLGSMARKLFAGPQQQNMGGISSGGSRVRGPALSMLVLWQRYLSHFRFVSITFLGHASRDRPVQRLREVCPQERPEHLPVVGNLQVR